MITQAHKPSHHSAWPALALIGALVIGGAAFGAWYSGLLARNAPAAQAKVATPYQTSAVRRSDLSLTADGNGQVVPGRSANLGFLISGTIQMINAQVGDTVSAGQVLATLAGADARQKTIAQKQADLQAAQQALDQLTSAANQGLAQAASNLASAQAAAAQAQNGVLDKHDPRCAPSLTQNYYFQYLHAVNQVAPWEDALNDPNTGYGRDFILKQLYPLRQERDQAYNNWQWCQGYTDLEIQASQARLQVAQANLTQAQATYQALKANSGIDPNSLALAQATLNNAQVQLASAQDSLAAAQVTAPFNGTITAVNGVTGQSAGKNALITLADLSQPQVQVSIDETDLPAFATNCPAQVTFSALPNQTFNGIVTQVYPALVTVNNASSARGLVNLTQKVTSNDSKLPIGLNAQVTITCQQAKDALVVPLQAIYDSNGTAPYVYILDAQGRPDKRPVQVGLKTSTLVEIKSGLSEGEQVITSPVKQ